MAINPIIINGTSDMEVQLISNNAKIRYLRFNAALSKWANMGPWTHEKQRVWIKYACAELKTREAYYKLSKEVR